MDLNPASRHKIVKKRVKKFTRHQSDRYDKAVVRMSSWQVEKTLVSRDSLLTNISNLCGLFLKSYFLFSQGLIAKELGGGHHKGQVHDHVREVYAGDDQ